MDKKRTRSRKPWWANLACVLTALVVAASLTVAVGAAGASSHPNYPLGKAKSCKAHYVKRTERHLVNGKEIRYVACVYVAPSNTTTTLTTTTTPTVTSVSPSSGSTAGGTSVTVTGTNLTAATAVNFGVTPATNLVINSATSITVTSPAEPAWTSDVTVTVTGTNLTAATAVNFGVTPATNLVINSATSITVTSPAEPAWTSDVTVTTSAGTSTKTTGDHYTFSAAPPTAPGVPHVMEIMMENEAYGDLIGNAAAPNINQLTQTYALATQSYAIGHSSLPNYLEMIAGSNYGVSDNGTPTSENITSTAPTFANQFETAGISWRAYFESMPSAGYTGGDTGGVDPYGGEYYLQHHNPFVYFPATTSLADFDQNVVPLSSASGVQRSE